MDAGAVVLIFGDVNGQFEALFKKMDKVHRKVGHIAFALCVGNFFKEGCDSEWERVKRYEICPCTQIFILGPTKPELIKYYPSFNHMTDLADRITFLGKSGIFRTAEGIKIAFVSGTFSAEAHTNPTHINYSYKNIYNILQEADNSGRVDIVMTYLCPNHFGWHVETNNFPETGELPPAVLFSFLFPKYHMATTEKECFETATLRYLKNGACAGASRLFGIPALGKKKWLKAFNITPSSLETRDVKIDLSRIVALDIPDLHEFWHIMQSKAMTPMHYSNYTNYFYDIPRKRRSDETRKAFRRYCMKERKKEKSHRCWFCLSKCGDQKHLVVSIGDHAFMALAKGPVVEDHVLISSVAHRNSARNLEEETRQEINKFREALRRFYRPNRVPVFYERAYKSSHLQIHCIPVPMNKAGCVLPAFKELAAKYRLKVEVHENSRLAYMKVSADSLYFYADLPYKTELIITGDPEKFPLNFGREALVMESVLNVPGHKNWKDCVQSKEVEEKAADDFKKRFNKFDFTLE